MENSSLLKLVFCILLSSSAIGNALTIKEAKKRLIRFVLRVMARMGLTVFFPLTL